MEYNGPCPARIPPSKIPPSVEPSLSSSMKNSQDEAMRSLVAVWGNWEGFNVSADPCTWGWSVYCDENGFVYDLSLREKGLQGEIVALRNYELQTKKQAF